MDEGVRQQLTRVAPTLSTWPSSLRRGGIMAALLAAGALSGHYVEGVAATTGALNIALLDACVARSVLARALGFCLVTTTIVGFAAVLIGPSWALIPFLATLAFLQGALAGGTLALANAGIASMITAILFSAAPGTLEQAASSAGWLLVGAVLESGVALVAWHWERQGLPRRQIGVALRLRGKGASDDTVRTWTCAAEESLASAELSDCERVAFDGLLRTLRAGADIDPTDARSAARRLRRVPASSRPGPLNGWVERVDGCMGRVTHAPAGSLRHQVAELRARMRPGTSSFDAGLRLAALMTVGAVVVRWFEIPQGHWVLLVFALAVRADYSGTVASLLARAVGVLAGVVLVVAVAAVTGGSLLALLAVASLAAVLTCRWLMGNPVLFFVWLTVFVSVLVDVPTPGLELGLQRIMATLLGVAIGLVVSLMWPGWRPRRRAAPRTVDP